MRGLSGEYDGGQTIVYGAGSRSRVPALVRDLGGTRALVLSTAGRAALAATVVDLLGPLAVGTFDGAVMHTPVGVTEQALTVVADLGADALVSIGGGSTIGLGKALSVRTGLPHVAIPTTYAGSEVTPVLGETVDGVKTTRSAPEIRPATVIYDVDLTLDLPWAVTLTSAVNAMAHAVEATYAPERTAEADETARGAMHALAHGLRVLRSDARSREARDDLLYGAWQAGTCLARGGMGLHHQLCHTLGGAFGLPHAATHTVVLPYAMDYNARAVPTAIAAAEDALGVPPGGLRDLIDDLGGPTDLAGLGLAAEDLDRAADLVTDPTRTPYPNPREVTRERIRDLLTRATRGTPIGDHQ